jgi:hypothetical protein
MTDENGLVFVTNAHQRCVSWAALTQDLSKALKSQRFYVSCPYYDKPNFSGRGSVAAQAAARADDRNVLFLREHFHVSTIVETSK